MEWTVIGKMQETPGVVTIRFKPSKKVSFRPGQYFIFYDMVDYLEDCRAYSASSSPSHDYVDITVKLVQNPHFSKHLQNLPVGYAIEVRGPHGSFCFDDSAKDVVLIGAGSGIAPLRSILQYTAEKESGANVTLIYSAKTKEQVIFLKELQEISDAGKVKLFITLTQEQGEFTGRIDSSLINKAVPDKADKMFFICGPPLMAQQTQKILRELGASEGQIKSEEF